MKLHQKQTFSEKERFFWKISLQGKRVASKGFFNSQLKVKQSRIKEKTDWPDFHHNVCNLFGPRTNTIEITNQKILEESKATTKTADDLKKNILIIASPDEEKPKAWTNTDPNLSAAIKGGEEVKQSSEKKL